MALAAIFLLARRLAGGLITPLPPSLLMSIGLIVAAAAWTVHILSPRSRQTQVTILSGALGPWLAVLALPIFALAVSLPGSSTFGLVVLWLTIGSAEIGLWRLRKNRHLETALLFRQAGNSLMEEMTLLDDKSSLLPLHREAATATQKLVYHRSVDGQASVEGWLRTNFIADQRTAIVHVAFCPAFEQTPGVEAELLDGPPCEIKPTLVLPWGVRWEVKLDSPASAPTTATIEFIAREPS
jgi:hypothetical protein